MFAQVINQAAETVVVVPGHMVFPPIVFGILALVIMVALMAVTFSFRNMASAHPERSRVIRHEPVGHPGQPIIESGDQH
ncbi:hypothetical protein [uncultured Gulosibacter sp.]|uniref:hypothetical protein n=1 Tax=uncultured Gulosibacter sp. TaxID=1339167 RepID=UPI00288C079C|nr:hypothetical protein [uncultured Gulosibacter sp.]